LRHDRPDDLRDDVAGPPDDHRVARTHVLARDLILVVQRRRGHRDAADEDRLEPCERRHLSGPAGVHLDRTQERRALLGRELERDRPPRSLRRRPELVLQRDPVDLDHGAVDLPVDAVAVLSPVLEVALHAVDVVARFRRRRHRQPRAGCPSEEAQMRLEADPLGGAERVHPQMERSRRGDARVLLTERAGRRVARVRERPLLVLGQLPVQLLEGLDRQVHLAADLDQVGGVVERERARDVPYGADVRGDVLTGDAVAARRRSDEHAAFVRQGARHTVDLQLARERRVVADAADDPLVPGVELLERERVVERAHRRQVADRCEQRRRGAADRLRRGIRCLELRELGLELLELPHQRVVLDVGDLGVVEDVVAVPMVLDQGAELLDADLRVGAAPFLRRRGRRHVAVGPSLRSRAHPAISTAPETPMRSPTTTTPPSTPGTRWR
jgi:hypothetical protein